MREQPQEERAWERSMDVLIEKLLRTDHQNTLDSALDKLFRTTRSPTTC